MLQWSLSYLLLEMAPFLSLPDELSGSSVGRGYPILKQRKKLCSILFLGTYVFGPVLDNILVEAADKKTSFQKLHAQFYP